MSSLFEGSREMHAKALKQFSWYKKVLGIKCQIIRYVRKTEYDDVIGAVYSSHLFDNERVVKRDYVIVINTNHITKALNESQETLECYDNNNVIKIGDVIMYNRKGREFRYKVIDVETFTEVGGVLNKYTLQPFVTVHSDSSKDAEDY